ncbi:formate dehydrogenase accessory protein FdhE [Ottowia testudinis]|uniref:Protein FdhE homolog n=1 Tax=Ottowia testudinis TaxID=2816950 RepID=A0A975H419_9BURK|nr:formate dehydrogenase accessory protein FdhE [Ottowia testudinis]QTD46399.1 formate dehydrogenase accessory protein FdhE [Ottowia testudinis]
MNSFSGARLRTPEEIALNAGADFARLLPPQPGQVFAGRAVRMRQLAAGHAMRDYLLLMAVICEAQHEQLATYPAVALPSREQAGAAATAGQPLLHTASWPRDPVWREEWRALLGRVLNKLPEDSPARPSVEALRVLPDDALERQADRLLAGIGLGVDLAAAPLIAAGLQLHWTHLVSATAAAQPGAFGMTDDATRCPCCGSLPTASITRIGGEQEGYRYLHCALCSAQWHMVRVKCTHCQGTGGIQYQALQALADAAASGEREAVQAETCDVCSHYLKIVHMGKDLHVEPVADDLATLTLDLLVSDAGFTRHGINFLLLFGDEDAADAAPPDPDRGPR